MTLASTHRPRHSFALLLAGIVAVPLGPVLARSELLVERHQLHDHEHEEAPEIMLLDLSNLASATVAFSDKDQAWEFDGKKSWVSLDAKLPARIGKRTFSIGLEARIDRQPEPTAYLIEHHRAFPWTGLFLAVHDNQKLRFRLKDLPHCDVLCDIQDLVGDGRFHEIVLHREEERLEIVIDGKSRVSEKKPEWVDLDIAYGEHPPTVGAHCLADACFFKGAIRGLTLRIGELLDDPALAKLQRDRPDPDGLNEKVESLVNTLRTGDARARADALRALKDLAPFARRRLASYRDDPDPEIYETIQELLGTSNAR